MSILTGSENVVDVIILPPAATGVHVRVVLELPLDVNVVVRPAAGALDGVREDGDECSARMQRVQTGGATGDVR